MFMA
ncbi:hypothetical protein Mgra_00009371 [Meloidogyne graminicola]